LHGSGLGLQDLLPDGTEAMRGRKHNLDQLGIIDPRGEFQHVTGIDKIRFIRQFLNVSNLGGGCKYFLFSPRKLGKMNPF